MQRTVVAAVLTHASVPAYNPAHPHTDGPKRCRKEAQPGRDKHKKRVDVDVMRAAAAGLSTCKGETSIATAKCAKLVCEGQL